MKLQNVIRKDSLSKFEFGSEAMKKVAVCPNCHSLENRGNSVCSVCKSKLTRATLCDLYKSKHETCPDCGTVISKGMKFCPHCGRVMNPEVVVCLG